MDEDYLDELQDPGSSDLDSNSSALIPQQVSLLFFLVHDKRGSEELLSDTTNVHGIARFIDGREGWYKECFCWDLARLYEQQHLLEASTHTEDLLEQL